MKTKFKENRKLNTFGLTEWKPRHTVISVNPAKGDTANTIIHEYLHALFPWLKEEEVIKLSKRIERQASLEDIAELIKSFLKRTG